MQVHVFYNSVHEEILEKFFKATLPDSWELNAHFVDMQTDGKFLGENYTEILYLKCEKIIEVSQSLLDGEQFIWSDIDIVFNKNKSKELEEYIANLYNNVDDEIFMICQKDHPNHTFLRDHVNTGFFVVRNCSDFRILYKSALAYSKRYYEVFEQFAVNEIIQKRKLLHKRVSFLPIDEFPCFTNWNFEREGKEGTQYKKRLDGKPISEKAFLYHANYKDLDDKIEILQQVKDTFERREV